MDFGSLLHTAQKNEKVKNEVRYYSTKFSPPKKEKKSKELSENIKKFLAKKEAEEKRKAEVERQKRDELLALRSQDKRATRRVNVMLKRTKSANQSVIQDAVDSDNTAVTLAGPMQPDEDDYGYVSQEASAYYNKMMEKYSKLPEEPKFNAFKKKVSTNLSSTKDRVRAALEKEKEDALLPHRRKRKHKEEKEENEEDTSTSTTDLPEKRNVAAPPKPRSRPAPPPINFSDLLKIAEKKQFEPIVIEKKEKEEEKLLTKKQRKEMEKEREYLERKEARDRERLNGDRIPKVTDRIPKVTDKVDKDKLKQAASDRVPKKNIDMQKPSREMDNRRSEPNPTRKSGGQASSSFSSQNLQRKPSFNSDKNGALKTYKNNALSSQPWKSDKMSASSRLSTSNVREKAGPSNATPNGKAKDFPPRDLKMKKPVQSEASLKKSLGQDKRLPVDYKRSKFPPDDRPKEFPPRDLKPKQFPPADIRRYPKPIQKKPAPVVNKRRIIDDDSEYDSEMDDFIDDGDAEDDYSSEIQKIFGYDKSRYRDRDDDIDDMESSFAQQMKEEIISTKIGIMEDLEDIKKEEEEKRRKALMKKRKF